MSVDLDAEKIKLASLIGKRKALQEMKDKFEIQVEEAERNKKVVEKAILIMNYMISTKHKSVVELFEVTITSALQDIFGDDYQFKIEFAKRGSATTCEFLVLNKECPTWLPLRMSHGKSLQAVIAVILRILLVKLDKRTRDIVILDEPFEGLDEDKQMLIGRFIREIFEKFTLQNIMVTHIKRILGYVDDIKEI